MNNETQRNNPFDNIWKFYSTFFLRLYQWSYRDLSDIPPCQNMAQDRFMEGTTHESKLIRGRGKNSWPLQHSSLGAPQTTSNKLNPASIKDLILMVLPCTFTFDFIQGNLKKIQVCGRNTSVILNYQLCDASKLWQAVIVAPSS